MIWPPTGLCCIVQGKEDEPVPLLSCKATADIADDSVGVMLEQYFSNPGFGSKSSKQEVVYKFPLIGDAAVYHFKSDYLSDKGGILKTLVGRAKEKQQAREDYEQAKANGKAAQLLEMDYENSPDIFSMSLGNIPGNCKSVRVEIGFYCPLETEERGVVKRFTLPSVLTGRYGKYNPGAFAEANVENAQTLFSFEANICLGNSIASLESPTHKIISKLMVDGTPSKANVTFSQETEPLQQDLVLKINSDAVPKSSLLVQAPESMLINEDFEKDFPDTTLAKLTLNCKIEANEDAEIKKNFIFVVDRSLSMGGSAIENCKKALMLCLTCLPEDSCFDICSFGGRFDFLFGGKSQDYSAETLKQARDHVQAMSANYGGTEILKPLQQIVKAIADIPTVVFLMTDGQVYNTTEIVKLIKKEHEKSGTMLFSCGIGSDVDRSLVDGLAKAGGGTATYIAPGEKMNAKLAAQMEQALSPPCIGLKLDLGPLKISSSKLGWNPLRLLPRFAYSGQRLDCYLALDTNSVLEVRKLLVGTDDLLTVTLTGKIIVNAKEQTVVVTQIDLRRDFHETGSNLIVPAFRQQIKLTEEQMTTKKSERKKAIQFAVAANIVTRYTSLVAVEVGNEQNMLESSLEKPKPKPLPEEEERELMPLKSAPAASRFPSLGIGRMFSRRRPKRLFKPSYEKTTLVGSAHEPALRGISKPSNTFNVLDFHMRRTPPMEKIDAKPKLDTEDDKLNALIGLQEMNGSFTLTDLLKEIVNKTEFGDDEKLTGFSTALAIKFLEIKLADLSAEWKLMRKKAMKWLKKNTENPSSILDTAAKHIK